MKPISRFITILDQKRRMFLMLTFKEKFLYINYVYYLYIFQGYKNFILLNEKFLYSIIFIYKLALKKGSDDFHENKELRIFRM